MIPTGAVLATIGNYWSSKFGSTPTYSDITPRVVGGVAEPTAQDRVIRAYVDRLLDADPKARIVSLGDLNAPEYDESIAAHGSGRMFSMGSLVEDGSKCSYVFQGVAEAIDHQFASDTLRGKVESSTCTSTPRSRRSTPITILASLGLT